MAKNFNNKGRKPKAKPMPGQMSMSIDQYGGFYGYNDEIRLCSSEVSKKYWEKFDNFLMHSGRVSRPWHLYLAIKADPTAEEIAKMNGTEKAAAKSAVQKHQYVMVEKYRCKDVKELYKKIEAECRQYQYAYDSLIMAAREAGVDPKIRESYVKTFLSAFVFIDDCVQGDIRRDFYRRRYVKPALKAFSKDETAYVEPVDIREIEKAFEKDTAFKASFIRKRDKNKERRKKAASQPNH